MKTFDDVWTSLQPALVSFDGQRKKLILKYLKAVALTIVGTTLALSTFNLWHPGISFGLAAAVILGVLMWVSGSYDDFRNEYKKAIVGEIVRTIDPGLDYQPDSHISEEAYRASRLFLKDFDDYEGEDFVSGTLGQTYVRLSELHTSYEVQTKNGHYDVDIFKGVFFIADFNKHFEHNTVVLPDVAEKSLGRLGKFFQKMNLRSEKLVTLEDPEFEKEFAVYADDETEARYILTPALMKRLLEFRAKTNEIHVSFTGSHVNIAVSISRDLFEPRVFRTVVDRELIREYVDDIQFFAGIVEELNLNTRIWTKD